MKQLIRYNTFETNSSSMHSLCIVKEPIPYNKDDLCFGGYENFSLFGYCTDSDDYMFERYPFRVLDKPIDKLRYWVAYYVGRENNKKALNKVLKFVQQVTGLPKNKIQLKVRDEDKTSWPYGYVSCNDTGEDPMHYVEEHNISMEEFVMNPKYVVIVDGDEYCMFEKLIKSGVVNLDDLEDISTGKDYWDPRVEHFHINWFRQDEIFNDDILPNMDNAKNWRKIILEDDSEFLDLTNLQTWYDYVVDTYDPEIIIQTNRQQYFLDNNIIPDKFEDKLSD